MANIPLILNVVLIEICAILAIFFLIRGEDKFENKRYDLYHYDSGIRLHSLLMLISLIIISGNSMILFRICRKQKTKCLKVIHAIFHGIALILTIIAFIAMYRPKKKTKGEHPQYDHFLTIHAWCGIYSILMYILQFLIGFTVYLSVYVSWAVQDEYAYVHAFVGVASLLLDTIICCLGLAFLSSRTTPEVIAEAACIASKNDITYDNNISGLFITFFTGLVFYILVNPHNEWERVGEM